MKLLFVLLSLPLFISCKKSSNDTGPLKLLRKETPNYNGELVKMEYVYDAQGRITTVKKAKNNESLADAVTIDYTGNGVTLVSQPVDPGSRPYTFDKVVRLTVDASGKFIEENWICLP